MKLEGSMNDSIRATISQEKRTDHNAKNGEFNHWKIMVCQENCRKTCRFGGARHAFLTFWCMGTSHSLPGVETPGNHTC